MEPAATATNTSRASKTTPQYTLTPARQ
jgi:hypothetical protein